MARHIPPLESAQMVLDMGWDDWTAFMESRLSDGEMFVERCRVTEILEDQYAELLQKRLDSEQKDEMLEAQIKKYKQII